MSLQFKILLVIILVAGALQAQDPELLMNEFRTVSLAAQTKEFNGESEQIKSYGAFTGVSYSLGNLIGGSFDSKRFRMGDLLSADIGLGYTTDTTLYNAWLVARVEVGAQAYYAINDDLDVGMKLYYLLNADIGEVSQFMVMMQPVIRYKRFILDASLGLENSNANKHYQGSFKYIYRNDDRLKTISLRYELLQDVEDFKISYISIGLTTYFAANR